MSDGDDHTTPPPLRVSAVKKNVPLPPHNHSRRGLWRHLAALDVGDMVELRGTAYEVLKRRLYTAQGVLKMGDTAHMRFEFRVLGPETLGVWRTA